MPIESRFKKAIRTFMAVRKRVQTHNVMVSTAGIAFYGLLSLVPSLIALVSVYALLADPNEIEAQVTDLASSLDEDTRGFLTSQLQSIVGDVESQSEGSSADRNLFGRWIALAFGILFALFSASGAMQKLMATVSLAYGAEETRRGWKVRALAYLFTAGAIIGVALIVFLIGFLPIILDTIAIGSLSKAAITVVQPLTLGLLFAGGLTIVYRYAPDRPKRTNWKNRGALVGTLLFIIFAAALSFYSSNIGVLPASYGLLGSVAALMIFLQLTSLAIILGAEVNSIKESELELDH